MPTTLAAAGVMIGLLVPGIIGESIYSRVTKSDNSGKEIIVVLRVVMVSVLGLILYTTVAKLCHWPEPAFLAPETFTQAGAVNLSNNLLGEVILPYMGHIVGGVIVGAAGVPLDVMVRVIFQQPRYGSAWDFFSISMAQTRHGVGRWVQVQLIDGRLLIGILSGFDAYDKEGERDVVLGEPEYWSEEANAYIVYPVQSIFLPGRQVYSISVLYDPTLDVRVTKVPDEILPPIDNANEESH